MRFTTAWAQVASQNTVLKVTVIAFTMVTTSLAVVTLRLSRREPLVIDRACRSTAVLPASGARTKAEIEDFVRHALSQRFDTSAVPVPGHLSPEEQEMRRQEQEELRASQITQRVVLNGTDVSKDLVRIDADRLVSVGRVRSAFPFPLEVAVETVPRTEGNPAGLQLSKVTPVKLADDKPAQEAK